MMKGQSRIRIGNVYAIPLPDRKFAFGRKLGEASIAIYKHIGESIKDTPQNEEYRFIVGVYKDV